MSVEMGIGGVKIEVLVTGGGLEEEGVLLLSKGQFAGEHVANLISIRKRANN